MSVPPIHLAYFNVLFERTINRCSLSSEHVCTAAVAGFIPGRKKSELGICIRRKVNEASQPGEGGLLGTRGV